MDFTTLLEEMIEGWEYAREGVIAEAEVFDDDEFMTFRATEDNRTPAELCRHILEAGLLAVGETTNPNADLPRQGFTEHLAEHAAHLPDDLSRTELMDQLRSSLEDGVKRLREFGELGMLQGMRRFDKLTGTRYSWFQHHIAHEEYHRGQLALYNRLCGHVPALTQMIQANTGS